VVITSSITGNRTAMPNMSHYAASKGAVNGFIRGAAFELARYNIMVNGVEPGMIDTEGLRTTMEPGLIAELARIMPIGRFGTVEDVAYAMAFLASDEAQFITGQTIVVDGGQTLAEVQSMVEPPVRLE
jgi:3-oxoacyl-[acyl-carrier protein] reductase